MPPEDTRADIEEHVRRLAPPTEFLQRGKELIGTQGRGCLRWPGQRSFCKVVGQSLGGPDASGAWRWLEADRDARAIVAARFVRAQRSGVTETRLAYVAGADQLLDPSRPQRWGLLRAVADELSTHAAKSEDVHLDQATRDYHLGACWGGSPGRPLETLGVLTSGHVSIVASYAACSILRVLSVDTVGCHPSNNTV